MVNELHSEPFWSEKWKTGTTPWDIGYISTPLKEYFDQLNNKSQKILIPGAGNSYEAEYLHKNHFTNVYIVDIAEAPLIAFKKRIPDFPEDHILHIDFFDLEMQFDLIIEQTFFCSLHPSLREMYVLKIFNLLKDNGKLIGLLFKFPFSTNGPPFGGNKEKYLSLFRTQFNILIMEDSYNSIKPRIGTELFFKLEKTLST